LALGVAMIGLTARANAQGSPAPTPLATADGETSGMQIQVKQLKRIGGNVVMLGFEIINNSDNSFKVEGALLPVGDCCRTDVSGVYLVDLSGKKKYEVVRDSDKHPVCSRDFPNIEPKSSANLWAKFPAPPDNVQKLGIVVPHFLPMDDVPLAAQ
jgi:hypothetical protein